LNGRTLKVPSPGKINRRIIGEFGKPGGPINGRGITSCPPSKEPFF